MTFSLLADPNVVVLEDGTRIHCPTVTCVKSHFYEVFGAKLYGIKSESDDVTVCSLCRAVGEWDSDFRETHVCPPVELIALRDRVERGF